MIKKYLLNPERIRRIPKQFSWLDHRLVQDGYLQRCQAESLALYLFLAAVSDSQGLSYYSDASVCKRLHFSANALSHAREELIKQGMIAYCKPLYQLLDLKPNRWNCLATSLHLKNTEKSHLPSPGIAKTPTRGALVRTRQTGQNTMQHIGEIIAQMEKKRP